MDRKSAPEKTPARITQISEIKPSREYVRLHERRMRKQYVLLFLALLLGTAVLSAPRITNLLTQSALHCSEAILVDELERSEPLDTVELQLEAEQNTVLLQLCEMARSINDTNSHYPLIGVDEILQTLTQLDAIEDQPTFFNNLEFITLNWQRRLLLTRAPQLTQEHQSLVDSYAQQRNINVYSHRFYTTEQMMEFELILDTMTTTIITELQDRYGIISIDRASIALMLDPFLDEGYLDVRLSDQDIYASQYESGQIRLEVLRQAQPVITDALISLTARISNPELLPEAVPILPAPYASNGDYFITMDEMNGQIQGITDLFVVIARKVYGDRPLENPDFSWDSYLEYLDWIIRQTISRGDQLEMAQFIESHEFPAIVLERYLYNAGFNGIQVADEIYFQRLMDMHAVVTGNVHARFASTLSESQLHDRVESEYEYLYSASQFGQQQMDAQGLGVFPNEAELYAWADRISRQTGLSMGEIIALTSRDPNQIANLFTAQFESPFGAWEQVARFTQILVSEGIPTESASKAVILVLSFYRNDQTVVYSEQAVLEYARDAVAWIGNENLSVMDADIFLYYSANYPMDHFAQFGMVTRSYQVAYDYQRELDSAVDDGEEGETTARLMDSSYTFAQMALLPGAEFVDGIPLIPLPLATATSFNIDIGRGHTRPESLGVNTLLIPFAHVNGQSVIVSDMTRSVNTIPQIPNEYRSAETWQGVTQDQFLMTVDASGAQIHAFEAVAPTFDALVRFSQGNTLLIGIRGRNLIVRNGEYRAVGNPSDSHERLLVLVQGRLYLTGAYLSEPLMDAYLDNLATHFGVPVSEISIMNTPVASVVPEYRGDNGQVLPIYDYASYVSQQTGLIFTLSHEP